MADKLTHTYDDFLKFVSVYHSEYVLECQREGQEPKEEFEYLNQYFFWLVDQYKESQNLLKQN